MLILVNLYLFIENKILFSSLIGDKTEKEIRTFTV